MRILSSPSTVWQTLRHLRLRQVRFQLARRLLPAGRPAPLALRWRPLEARAGAPKHDARARFDGEATFIFNNESRRFDGAWNDPSARKLWRYNLHYMAWIFDLPAEAREGWMRRWIEGNPFERGGDGWEPYPLSLRIFNWCRHYAQAGTLPPVDIRDSLALQTAALLSGLEFHLDGNHLLENLLALAFAGFHLDPEDPRAARTLRRIRLHLEATLVEQFLPDGGHYELSPMYHAILLERMLDLLDAWPEAEDPFPGLRPRMHGIALRALAWLDVMSVDGRFALFNDSAYDTAPEAAALLDFGSRLLGYTRRGSAPLAVLRESGYYRAEAGPFTLLFDGGPLGPDHQMGHAQGDMLSLCLWLREVPVLVHPGNYEYLPGAMRDYCRSTASHNTLAPEGHEQAEWWASHRVGWRGRPRGAAAFEDQEGTVHIRGSHDGYSRLPGRPLHLREVEVGEETVVVKDSLSAPPGRLCRVRWHVHPDCLVEAWDGTIRLRSAGGTLMVASDHPMTVEDAWHCPEFGLRFRSRAIVATGTDQEYRCSFTLES